MNKLQRIGKTIFEVMKMKKMNKDNPLPLRKYYKAMVAVFVLFLGVMAYYSVQFKNKRELAKQEVKLDQSVDVDNSATQGTTEVTTSSSVTDEKKEKTKTTETMQQTVSYNGKTKLSWPLTGNIILPFSVDATIYFESLDQYRISKGILIEAKQGDNVKAVKQAKVAEIGKTAEYGQTVLLDLGNGYTALYGQLKDLQVKQGDTVETGQIIGKVALPTDYYTLEGTNLYFQMEKDKKPVDPGKYLE
ncbi:hypothetical protein BHF70_09905 [Anaerostipes sp. 494a]|nr:hypothetical protein BHF70_09905 [Anaerostipes sp. 494a]